MILIFAVDENWGIGLEGRMLIEIKEDLKRFKRITHGNIVVMGRKTLKAIPGEKPLEGRINIIVTRQRDFKRDGFYVLNDLKDLHKLLDEINPRNEKKVFITGGGSIASQLLPLCNKAYITKILKDFHHIDTYVPNLDILPHWKKLSESPIHSHGDIKYKYVDYVRIKNKD